MQSPTVYSCDLGWLRREDCQRLNRNHNLFSLPTHNLINRLHQMHGDLLQWPSRFYPFLCIHHCFLLQFQTHSHCCKCWGTRDCDLMLSALFLLMALTMALVLPFFDKSTSSIWSNHFTLTDLSYLALTLFASTHSLLVIIFYFIQCAQVGVY